MNLSSVRHSFVLKTSKNKSNEAAIYHRLRLVVNGRKIKTLEISSRLTVQRNNWDGKIKGKSDIVRERNDDLEQQRAAIKNLFNTEVTKVCFDPDVFKMLIQGKVMGVEHINCQVDALRKPKTIGDLFSNYIERYESQLSVRRVKLYKFVNHEFLAYVKKEYRKSDVEVTQVNRDDFFKFKDHLGVCRMNNTVSSYLKALKAVVNNGIDGKNLTHSPFFKCTASFVPGERTALDMEELQRIVDIDASELTPRENISRWVFIFSCFTALSYSDLVKLKSNMICSTNEGLIIQVNRTKTKVKAVIPHNAELESVLQMFSAFKNLQGSERKLLPVPSYNKYNNEDLKVIGRKANISKNISSHIGRHTFACHWLAKGGSYETLSKILGHKKISTTEIYGKVGTDRVIEESKKVYAGNTLQVDKVAAGKNINELYYQTHLTRIKVHGTPANADIISSEQKKKVDGRASKPVTTKVRSRK